MVVLVATMRSGSDLLHSLLDGHPQVMQMPGHWDPYGMWDALPAGADAKDIVDAFVRDHPSKFESSRNPRERWDALGSGGDSTFSIDVCAFRQIAISRLGGAALTPYRMIEAITLAYGEARGVDVTAGRLILVHAHYFTQLDRYAIDFPSARVLCTVRDPRNGLLSWVRTLDTHDAGELVDTTIASQVERALTNYLITVPGLRQLPAASFVQLEELHRDGARVMRDLSTQLGIDADTRLLSSTVNGLEWGGDRSSGRTLRGLNPNAPARQPAYATGLSRADRVLVEALLARPMQDLGYPVPRWSGALGRLAGPLLALRTMDIERTLEARLSRGAHGGAASTALARRSRQSRRRSCLIRWASLWRPRPVTGTLVGRPGPVHW